MNASRVLRREERQSIPSPRPSSAEVARRRWFDDASPAQRANHVGRLFTAHRSQVLRSLRGWGLSEADAEDVCSEVFVVALRSFDRFEGRSAPSTWLVGIARKLASDLRRSARVRLASHDEAPDVGTDETPERALQARQAQVEVAQAVAALKPAQRNTVRRFMLDEVDMHQVASEQGVPLQTAYARLYAGQTALRLVLG